jgi:hypothetical protein
MPEIYLVGFRGTGSVTDEESPYFSEPALVRAGHVAIGGVIPDTLIGFSPTPEAAEAAGGELALLKLLKDHIAQHGRLQDDTAVFNRAKALAAQGERTTVFKLTIQVSDETFKTIETWYNDQKEAKYNFPNEDDTFEPDEYNCGTFPALLGVPIPSHSGSIKTYIGEMILKGAIEW